MRLLLIAVMLSLLGVALAYRHHRQHRRRAPRQARYRSPSPHRRIRFSENYDSDDYGYGRKSSRYARIMRNDGDDYLDSETTASSSTDYADNFYPRQRIHSRRFAPFHDPWFGQCATTITHAAFFIDRNVKSQETDFVKGRPAAVGSCAACVSGSQFSYRAVNLDGYSMADALTRRTAIGLSAGGQLYCDRNDELCVETVEGRFLRGHNEDGQNDTAGVLRILAVPWADEDGGWMLGAVITERGDKISLVSVDANGAAEKIERSLVDDHDKRNEFGETLPSPANFGYLRLRGISCNGCRDPLPLCDSAARLNRRKNWRYSEYLADPEDEFLSYERGRARSGRFPASYRMLRRQYQDEENVLPAEENGSFPDTTLSSGSPRRRGGGSGRSSDSFESTFSPLRRRQTPVHSSSGEATSTSSSMTPTTIDEGGGAETSETPQQTRHTSPTATLASFVALDSAERSTTTFFPSTSGGDDRLFPTSPFASTTTTITTTPQLSSSRRTTTRRKHRRSPRTASPTTTTMTTTTVSPLREPLGTTKELGQFWANRPRVTSPFSDAFDFRRRRH